MRGARRQLAATPADESPPPGMSYCPSGQFPSRNLSTAKGALQLLGVSGSLASRKTSSNCSRSAEWRTVAASPRIVHRQVFLLNSTATLARTVARRRLADFERVAAEIVVVQLDQIEGVQEHAGVVSAVTDALEARHSIVVTARSRRRLAQACA